MRYIFFSWRSAYEAVARWRGSAGDEGIEDVFFFGFLVSFFLLVFGFRVYFALRYRVVGVEYWDNNNGRDYSFTCRNYALYMSRGECEESWIYFI